MTKVLVVATSRKTRGGITSVVKAHEQGRQWKKFHCRWIETHRDGNAVRKLWYLITGLLEYVCLLPFYDVVHIHVGLRTSVDRKMIFAKIAKMFHKKIIIHFHPATEKHLFDSKHHEKIKNLFDYSDMLLVLSPQWIQWINEAYPQNQYNMKVLFNPCPLVVRNNAHRKLYILFAGTLNERKGYNRLLEAFSLISARHLDWKLIFAGNGEIVKAKEIQRQLEISDSQIEYLGWVYGEAKDKIFQEASIYCLPSWGEGFPMGVLDAIAYGIPVVTTPVGGIMDVMKNGVDCLIYDTFDVKSLSVCLEKMMDSRELRTRIAEEADKLKDKEFNIKCICEQLDNLYAEISK